MRHYLCLAVLAAAGVLLAAAPTPPASAPATRAGAAPAATAPGGAFATPPAAKLPADPSKLDDKGYIRQWLVIAPINFGGEYAADNIEKEQIPMEASLAPKEGDKQKVKSVEADKSVEKEFTWKKVVTSDYFVDFNEMLKMDSSEAVGAYAVVYLDAPEEMKDVTFSFSTNDDGLLYFNGKKIWSLVVGRALEEDSDKVEHLTLNKGTNTIVFKVWNDSNNWQACLRLLDKAGKPITNVKTKLTK